MIAKLHHHLALLGKLGRQPLDPLVSSAFGKGRAGGLKAKIMLGIDAYAHDRLVGDAKVRSAMTERERAAFNAAVEAVRQMVMIAAVAIEMRDDALDLRQRAAVAALQGLADGEAADRPGRRGSSLAASRGMRGFHHAHRLDRSWPRCARSRAGAHPAVSAAPLTQPQRGRLKRLALENEPTIKADRRFFERQPERNFRVRLASPAECETLRIHNGHTVDENSRWYAAVKQERPGWQLRAFTAADAEALAQLITGCGKCAEDHNS